MNQVKSHRIATTLLLSALSTVMLYGTSTDANAGLREQAKRMHDRLAGVPADNATLDSMVTALGQGDPALAASTIAMNNPNFLNVTVKNMVIPMTNEEMTVFAPLNDTAATLIGMVRDGVDFRRALYDNIIYTGSGVAAYSNSNNTHYEQLESQNVNLRTNLTQQAQTAVTGMPTAAVAGVMTTRASARAFFVDGTNRAMFRFTMLNYLCKDLEDVKDTSRVPDRVRQDVSRSPGGDSSVYLNTCMGCHAGMDGLAGAFAYHQWSYTNDNPDAGQMSYTAGTVQQKYLINANVFPYGFITADDGWINRWRQGPNTNLGWGWAPGGNTAQTVTTGNGAASMGQELANTQAFARCQARKVYRTVCFNDPAEATLQTLVTSFSSNNFDMRRLFADSAYNCRGN